MNATKWIKFFVYSAGAILLLAGLERLLIATDRTALLSLPEGMLGIRLRYAVLLAAVIELTVAFTCLFGRQTHLQIGWLVWLVINYTLYRIGLSVMGGHSQSACIGSLTDPLHLSRGITGTIALWIPVYLLLGGCTAWAWLWSENRRLNAARHLKMSCPACGVHIRFAIQNLGQKAACLYCGKVITLRQPDLLKMACFFCAGHIEFPDHAIGEKLKCPHCQMDITLKEPAVA